MAKRRKTPEEGPIDAFVADVAEALTLPTARNTPARPAKKHRRATADTDPPLDSMIADVADVLAKGAPSRKAPPAAPG